MRDCGGVAGCYHATAIFFLSLFPLSPGVMAVGCSSRAKNLTNDNKASVESQDTVDKATGIN